MAKKSKKVLGNKIVIENEAINQKKKS